MGRKGIKKPGRVVIPREEKRPRVSSEIPTSFDTEFPSWHIGTIDRDGPWGWTNLDANILWRVIYSKMSDFETMTWAEIKGRTGSHSIPVSDIIRDAQNRLSDINQSDVDKLFSLRLSGTRRIWGIMDRYILKIIWWDPDHEICPSDLRYT